MELEKIYEQLDLIATTYFMLPVEHEAIKAAMQLIENILSVEETTFEGEKES